MFSTRPETLFGATFLAISPDHPLAQKIADSNENIKDFRIGEVAHVLYDFFWNSYCDWYVEIAKIQLQDEKLRQNTQRVMLYVLDQTLRLLHPIMPHITEAIWQKLPLNKEEKLLMKSKFPTYSEKYVFESEAKEMEFVFETIKSLRNVRQAFNIPVSLKMNIEIISDGKEKEIFSDIEAYIKRLSRVEDIKYIDEKEAENIKQAASAIVGNSKIVIPLKDLIDINAEIDRQNKKLEKVSAEKKSLLGRVNNPKFVANAPSELVEQTKARIDELEQTEKAIEELISSLKI